MAWFAVAQEFGARDSQIVKQVMRELNGQHDAGRIARKSLIVGDLPEPGATPATQDDRRRNCAAIDKDAVDRRFAFRGKIANRRGDKTPKLLVTGNSGTGSAFPAARFEREKIVERPANGCGFTSGRDQDRAGLRQAPPFTPEFFLLVSADLRST